MTSQEEKIIAGWSEGIPEEIPLTVAWRDDEPGRQIRAFCKSLQRLVPRIRVKEAAKDAVENMMNQRR